jgi:hypothetical protein
MNISYLRMYGKHRILERAKYGRIYMIYMKYKIVIAAFPLLLLGVAGVTSQAFAWGYWNDGGGGGGRDYWGHGGYENSFLQNFYPQPGPGAYENGYSAGISDAVYDDDNGLVYNPVGQCLPCHSQVYWDGFHQGYDTQWNSYQVQTQNTDQRVNNYIQKALNTRNTNLAIWPI